MDNCPSMGSEASLTRSTAESRKKGGKQYSRENAYNCSGIPCINCSGTPYIKIKKNTHTTLYYYFGYLLGFFLVIRVHYMGICVHIMSTTVRCHRGKCICHHVKRTPSEDDAPCSNACCLTAGKTEDNSL